MDVAIKLVIEIFTAMALGFFLYRIKLLNDNFNNVASKFILLVTCTCMVFSAIVSIDSGVSGHDILMAFIVGFIIYAIFMIVAVLVTKLMKAPDDIKGVLQFLIIFGNVGFIGIPIANTMYGDAGLFYMSILNIHLNLFLFSYGIWLMSRCGNTEFKFSAKKLINPVLIAAVLAVILFLCKVRLPEEVLDPIKFIGDVTPAMSLVVIGSSIAAYPLKIMFTQWRLYVVAAVRMIIFPLAAYFIMKAIFGAGMITSVVTLYAGMPSAVAAGMFTKVYGGDEKTATAGVGLTSIISIVTLPGIYLLTTGL